MNALDIQHVLHKLGCNQIRVGSTGWVYSSCPVAAYRHPSGADTHPSFAVAIEPDGTSRYKCHRCQIVGELSTLIYMLQRLNKNTDYQDLMYFVQSHNAPSARDLTARLDRVSAGGYLAEPRKRVAGLEVSTRVAESLPVALQLPVLPESALDPMRALPDYIREYLTDNRHLTEQSISRWELGWHARMNRISIPIRSCENELVGISGRSYGSAPGPKYLHSSGFQRAYYLYGEHLATKQAPVILCEGFFDTIFMVQNGFNAVAMMGTHLSRFQAEKLTRLFTKLTLLLDGDRAGYEAVDKIVATMQPHMPVSVVTLPEGADPDDLSVEALRELGLD